MEQTAQNKHLHSTSKFYQILFLTIIVIFSSVPAFSQGIIIDHNCTDVSKVPESWITKVKNDFRMSYGHTSHGTQIVTGMEVLFDHYSLYAYNHDGSGGAFSLYDGEPPGDLGNPDRTTWYYLTRDLLDDPYCDRNIIMWSWCSQADTSEENIDLYLSLMTQLEQDYPNVKFIYMTGHVNGTGESGNLHQRNNQIRDYCIANNKILFDFADIESYDPDGNYFLDKLADHGCDYDSDGNGSLDANWADEWIAANPGSELAILSSDCGTCAHSRKLNCVLKGRAFWWMMARIAGWSGSSSTSITVTSPNGGESWQVGMAENITWTQTALTGYVTIDLYRGGLFHSNIGTELASAGSYSWDIPLSLLSGSNYKIRVYQGTTEDYSDENFSIIDSISGTIIVTSPNGGELLQRGGTKEIKWTQSGLTGSVIIDLYKDDKTFDSNIGTSLAEQEKFCWRIPSDANLDDNYRVVIRQGSVFDYSDGNFSIIERIKSFFDDFDYNSSDELLGIGEENWVFWPGLVKKYKMYTGKNVDVDNLMGNSVLVLSLEKDTRGGGVIGEEASFLETVNFFNEGTYAAKVWFDDNPNKIVQAFYAISAWCEYKQGLEIFAGCDFEYTPLNWWDDAPLYTPVLWANTHDKKGVSDTVKERAFEGSFGGKVLGLIIKVKPEQEVEYYIYDLSTSPPNLLYYPMEDDDIAPEFESKMLVSFRLWIKYGEKIDYDSKMYVDWVMHIHEDTWYVWEDLSNIVDRIRKKGLSSYAKPWNN